MCGIAGILSRSPLMSRIQLPEKIYATMKEMSHRGPDGRGEYVDDFVWFGHTRLAVIDLSCNANQPFESTCGRYVCTYNGEIYNYRELRQDLRSAGHEFRTESDTEVMLASYRNWGEACVNHLNGMFSFAIWDKHKRQLFLGRDRFGEKPLFVYQSLGEIAFSSEVRSLSQLLPQALQSLSLDAIDSFLRFGFVPESQSIFAGIKKVSPGEVITFSADTWTGTSHRYWNIRECGSSSNLGADNQKTRDRIVLQALKQAVGRTLQSDVPIAIALSGGIDSSAVAAIARELAPGTEFQAISVGYPDRPKYDERRMAADLAKNLRMPLHEVEVPVTEFVEGLPALIKVLGEPIADIAAFAHAAVPRAASEIGYKVLLTGLGGDELFWGYPWVQAAARSAAGKRHPLRVAWKSMSGIRGAGDFRSAVRETAGLFHRHSVTDEVALWSRQTDFINASKYCGQTYGRRMQAFCGHYSGHASEYPVLNNTMDEVEIMSVLVDTWLPANALAISDRVSMAVGVEARAPFLDVDLAETIMGLRRQTSDVFLGQKAWLRSALVGVLPSDIVARKKRGFQPPVHDWMLGAILAYGHNAFEGDLVSTGIFNEAPLRELMRYPNENAHSLFFAFKLTTLALSILTNRKAN